MADEYPYFENKMIEISKKLPETLGTGILSCGNNPRICYNLIIPINKGPQLILNYPFKKLIWYYRGNMTEIDILNWVNKVLSGKVRAAGPGSGFIGYIGSLFDMAKSKAGIYGIIFSAIFAFVFVMIFVLGISQSLRKYPKID